MLRWHISELWVTIVNVQESDFLLLTSPEDLSPQSARVATLNIHKKILFNCPRWQKPNTILTMCKATDSNGVDMILWYLIRFVHTWWCRSVGVPTQQPIDVAPVSTSQRILDILGRLSFLKILLLDIGLSLCDSFTDLVQAFREPGFIYISAIGLTIGCNICTVTICLYV